MVTPKQIHSGYFSFQRIVFALMILTVTINSAFAVNYRLPRDVGSGAFQYCSYNGSIIECTNDVTLNNSDVIRLSENTTIQSTTASVDFNFGNYVKINQNNNYSLDITTSGNISIGESSTVNANIDAGNDVTINNYTSLNGNIRATQTIEIGDSSDIAGNLTAGENIDLANYIDIDGNLNAGTNINLNDGIEVNGNVDAALAITSLDNTVILGAVNAGQSITFGRNLSLSGNINAGAEVTIDANADLIGNLSAGSTISFQDNAGILGNLQSGSNINIGDNSNITGDLLAAGEINIEKNTGILGNTKADLDIYFSDNANIQGNVTSGANLTFDQNPTLNGTMFATSDFNIALPNSSNGSAICFASGGNYSVARSCLSGFVSIPDPVLEYRFDESSWGGLTAEVIDSSASSAHGTAYADLSTDSVMCNAASLNGLDQYLYSPGLEPLRTTSTLSFWIKTPNNYTGTPLPWGAPVVTGYEENGGGDDIFWGAIDGNGKISMSKGNTQIADSDKTTFINDNTYHHITASWDSLTGAANIYIDGELDHSYLSETGDVSYIFSWIGLVEDSGGSLVYLNALIDEFIVFDRVLTPIEVRKIYGLQLNGLNLDETTRSCAVAKPAICISDDFERTALGSDWAVSSRSGSFGEPRIENGRLRINDSSGNVSTAATLFRLFPSVGNKIVVEFDYYAYNGGTNGGDGIALVFSDSAITPQPGGYGGSLGYAPKDSISGFAGGWMGIGFDEYGNFLNQGDGNKDGGFSSRVRETITIRGSGTGTSGYKYITSNGQDPSVKVLPSALSPTVQTETGHRYRVTIDHANGTNAWVTIERDTGSGFNDVVSTFDLLAQSGQAVIPEKMYLTITGSTGGAKNTHEIDNLEVCANTIEPAYFIDHYELDRDYDQGLTCEPLNISARACLNESCTTQVSEPVTTSFAPTSGWATSNTKTNYSSGDSFLFQQINTGTYTLDILNSTPSLKPLATEKVKCFIAGAEQTDCNVEFVDAAYRFFEPSLSSTSTPEYYMTAGQFLNGLEVRAIERNETTGECQAFLTNGSAVSSQIGTTCNNPTTCAANQQVSWHQSTTVNLANPENQVSSANTTTTGVTFSSNSTAQFDLMSPDVGLQVLTLTTPDYLDVDGTSSGRSITGSVNLKVSPANMEITSVTNSANNTNDSTNVFAKAGEQFNTTLQAYDVNGIAVESFGRITGLHDIDWSNTTLNAPVGGMRGDIIGSSVDASVANQWQGVDTDGNGSLDGVNLLTANGISYGDVGNINLVAELSNFMGFGTLLTSNAVNVGRFKPAFLKVTPTNAPNWGATSRAYQGYEEALGDVTFDITAYDIDGNPVDLYDGTSFKLPLTPDTNLFEKPSTLANTGGSLISASTWTGDSEANFDGTVSIVASTNGLNWTRKTNYADLSTDDQLTTINELSISASNFTDSDGVCIKTADTGACQDLTVLISQNSLHYARATLPDQVNATVRKAAIPVTLEYLESFEADGTPIFVTNDLESDFTNTILQGLDYLSGSTCTLTSTTDCSNIANLADASDSFTMPNGIGTNLDAGEGLFNIEASDDQQGVLQAHLQAPDWLSWYWNDTSVLEMSDTLILFGEYQGRAPILFTRPGYR